MNLSRTVNDLIDKIAPSTPIKSRLAIAEICEAENLPGGTTFIAVGKDNPYEYFNIEGVVRSYMADQNNNLVTLSFFEENSVISPHFIRSEDDRSTMSFETITACSLIKLPANDFGGLMQGDNGVRDFANTVLRQELVQKINKEIRLLSWSSMERLKQLRTDFHMLENRVPHTMIASYLGVTPVSLSRLRKTLSLS